MKTFLNMSDRNIFVEIYLFFQNHLFKQYLYIGVGRNINLSYYTS